jgi:hypothetical protein
MKKPSLVIALMLVVGIAATMAALPLRNHRVSFTTVARGVHSVLMEKQLAAGPLTGSPYQIVIKDQLSWEKLWIENSKSLVPTSNPSLPRIDFSKEMVAIIILGPSGGSDEVEIEEIVRRNETLEIKIVKIVTAPSAIVAQVITTPYHMVKLPRFDTPVRFLITTEIRN